MPSITCLHAEISCNRYFVNRSLPELVAASAAVNTDGSHDWDISVLVRNRMTWWLCGHACHPSTMSLYVALTRAVENLSRNIALV